MKRGAEMLLPELEPVRTTFNRDDSSPLDRAERRALRLLALHEVALAIGVQSDPAQTLDLILTQARTLLGAPAGSVSLHDDVTGELTKPFSDRRPLSLSVVENDGDVSRPTNVDGIVRRVAVNDDDFIDERPDLVEEPADPLGLVLRRNQERDLRRLSSHEPPGRMSGAV